MLGVAQSGQCIQVQIRTVAKHAVGFAKTRAQRLPLRAKRINQRPTSVKHVATINEFLRRCCHPLFQRLVEYPTVAKHLSGFARTVHGPRVQRLVELVAPVKHRCEILHMRHAPRVQWLVELPAMLKHEIALR